MRSSALTPIAAITLAAVVIGACGDDDGSDDGTIIVVATTTILGDVAANVVGPDGTVRTLMPVGTDPHDFRASAAQVADINNADLVITNGLGLEEGMTDVLEAAAGDGARVLELAPQLDPIPFGSAHADEDHPDESADPHVWLDPLRMAEAARIIAAELERLIDGPDWLVRAERYAGELTDIDKRVEEILSVVPDARRRLVTNHDSLGYFAARYDFTVVDTVIPSGSTLADPSSQQLVELIEAMEREAVTAIFAETIQPSALADAVAAELGQAARVESLFTGSLGEAGSGADTLVGMLVTNARRIAEALG